MMSSRRSGASRRARRANILNSRACRSTLGTTHSTRSTHSSRTHSTLSSLPSKTIVLPTVDGSPARANKVLLPLAKEVTRQFNKVRCAYIIVLRNGVPYAGSSKDGGARFRRHLNPNVIATGTTLFQQAVREVGLSEAVITVYPLGPVPTPENPAPMEPVVGLSYMLPDYKAVEQGLLNTGDFTEGKGYNVHSIVTPTHSINMPSGAAHGGTGKQGVGTSAFGSIHSPAIREEARARMATVHTYVYDATGNSRGDYTSARHLANVKPTDGEKVGTLLVRNVQTSINGVVRYDDILVSDRPLTQAEAIALYDTATVVRKIVRTPVPLYAYDASTDRTYEWADRATGYLQIDGRYFPERRQLVVRLDKPIPWHKHWYIGTKPIPSKKQLRYRATYLADQVE